MSAHATLVTCSYCRNPFLPEVDANGVRYELDIRDRACCDDCFCADCDCGHEPGVDCERALRRDTDFPVDEYRTYGDPDAAYERYVEPCLLDA